MISVPIISLRKQFRIVRNALERDEIYYGMSDLKSYDVDLPQCSSDKP